MDDKQRKDLENHDSQSKDPQANKQGQSASGQAQSSRQQGDTTLAGNQSQQGLSQPSHQQGVDGGSVTAAGGGSSGPGAGSAGLDRDQQSKGGFVGSQGEESGEYLQEGTDKANQGGFAEEGQAAPKGSQPGNIEGTNERGKDRGSDIEGSSKN